VFVRFNWCSINNKTITKSENYKVWNCGVRIKNEQQGSFVNDITLTLIIIV
jgi:hypothetical protein